MPKCLNDATKTYTGKEENPKGLGYSASGEKVGTIMKGLDGNDYIVKETKTCFKWELVKDNAETAPKPTKKEKTTTEEKPKKEVKTPKKKSAKDEKASEEKNTSDEETISENKEESEEPAKKEKDSTEPGSLEEFNQSFCEADSYQKLFDLFNNGKPEFVKKYKGDIVKFFFDYLIKLKDNEQLKDCFFKNVYSPVVSEEPIPEKDETGMESKFGGEKPFFMKGESWPEYETDSGEKRPYDFVCQYIDPTEKKDILVRVFLPLSDSDAMTDLRVPALILRIPFVKANRDKQIVIERPNAKKGSKYIEEDYTKFPAYTIEAFKKSTEIQQFWYLVKRFGLPTFSENARVHNSFVSGYSELQEKYFPSDGIKINGTRVFCAEHEVVVEENILQLSCSDYFNFEFGNNGIAHFNYDSHNNSHYVTWDSEE